MAIAAPPPETRELFCRHGLKYYARIRSSRVRAVFAEAQKQRELLQGARPVTKSGRVLRTELILAARMAAQSCHIMRWQEGNRQSPEVWPSAVFAI